MVFRRSAKDSISVLKRLQSKFHEDNQERAVLLMFEEHRSFVFQERVAFQISMRSMPP